VRFSAPATEGASAQCQSVEPDWHFFVLFVRQEFVLMKNFMCVHDLSACLAEGFAALSALALHDARVRPGVFFALVRELLSLAQRK
jgi:hypothetical protein